MRHTLSTAKYYSVLGPPARTCFAFLFGTVKEGEMARVHILVLQGDRVSFKGSKKVQVKSSPTINLMDLDKPFYKPGERGGYRSGHGTGRMTAASVPSLGMERCSRQIGIK